MTNVSLEGVIDAPVMDVSGEVVDDGQASGCAEFKLLIGSIEEIKT